MHGELELARRQASPYPELVASLDSVLDEVERLDRLAHNLLVLARSRSGPTQEQAPVDLETVGIGTLIGVDSDAERLSVAAGGGVRTVAVDLERDPLPAPSNSVGLVTCFGVLPYLSLYDSTLSEVQRVLEPGGWFLLSMPNLASLSNRMSMALGCQPAHVAVSEHRRAGQLRLRYRPEGKRAMPPMLHAAVHAGAADPVRVRRGGRPGIQPRRKRLSPLTRLADQFPSLSRRFLILARKRHEIELG